MRVRGVGATAGAAALMVAGLTTVMAPAAQAATLNSYSCASAGTTTIDMTYGETLVISGIDAACTMVEADDGVSVLTAGVVSFTTNFFPLSHTLAPGAAVSISSPEVFVTVTYTAPSNGTNDVFGLRGGSTQDIRINLSAPASPVLGPPAAVQGLPLPMSGNCADITGDASYAYGTGLTGGWTKVWGNWAQAWTCGRSLTYSTPRPDG
jgi:hypothetical protein